MRAEPGLQQSLMSREITDLEVMNLIKSVDMDQSQDLGLDEFTKLVNNYGTASSAATAVTGSSPPSARRMQPDHAQPHGLIIVYPLNREQDGQPSRH